MEAEVLLAAGEDAVDRPEAVVGAIEMDGDGVFTTEIEVGTQAGDFKKEFEVADAVSRCEWGAAWAALSCEFITWPNSIGKIERSLSYEHSVDWWAHAFLFVWNHTLKLDLDLKKKKKKRSVRTKEWNVKRLEFDHKQDEMVEMKLDDKWWKANEWNANTKCIQKSLTNELPLVNVKSEHKRRNDEQILGKC